MRDSVFSVEFSGGVIIRINRQSLENIGTEHADKLNTIEKVVAYIAYQMLFEKKRLSELDGWENQPDENARIIDFEPVTLSVDSDPNYHGTLEIWPQLGDIVVRRRGAGSE